MENPCRIVTFGDSITKAYSEHFQRRLAAEYSGFDIQVLNEGVIGETSTAGLQRIGNVLEHRPNVVLVGFGMNDWRKGVTREQFSSNIRGIVKALQAHRIRVLLLTMNPDWQGSEKGSSAVIDSYNNEIRKVAVEKRIRIVDVNALWKREIVPVQAGLSDEIHPNTRGYKLIAEALMRIVPRVSTTAVWQYNGYFAACNYACAYCYYPTKRHYFRYTVEEWREAFLNAFGAQRVTFYLSYGEPTLGKAFYDVLDMIASEPQWDAIVTTNLSQPLERLVQTALVKSGRLNINASFHPTQDVTVQTFLNRLLTLRTHGIEAPIVYVMYPEQMEAFPQYVRVFDRNGFFIHTRRFRGLYKNKRYPEAYTEVERRMVARYMDEISLKMMLSNTQSFKRLSYAGMYYIVVNNDGDIGASPEFPDYGKRGNLIRKTAQLDAEPQPYPGAISEGAVDGVATLLDLGLKELTGNHIWSFATQGGVSRDAGGSIVYPFINTDFSNPRVRRELNFGTTLSRLYYTLPRQLQLAD